MNKIRVCKGCGCEKSTDEFEGYKHFCVLCGESARKNSIRESKKRYSQNYRKNNPEKSCCENRRSKNKQYYSSDSDIALKYLFGHCKGRAKTRGYDFDLDIIFLQNLYDSQNSKCALTGIHFIFEKSNFGKLPFSPSIDRIDSEKGYTKDNVRLVCVAVNFALNEFGEEIFDKICEARSTHKNNEIGYEKSA